MTSRSLRRISRWTALGFALAAIVLFVGTLAAAPEPSAAPIDGAAGFHLKKGEDDCPTSTVLQCGATISGTLTDQDCVDDQGRALDVFTFTGDNGEIATATLEPTGFTGDLELFDPSFEDFAAAEGQFDGQTVTLQAMLNASSNLWRVVVGTDDAGENGPYQLTLQCTDNGTPPPPPPTDGYFLDPAYPNFRFRVRITAGGTTFDGTREPDCQPETVCVSGALPGRSEVYLRILGPRPNGFLWPTIVRFTPSRVVVDIEQISTGQTQTYVLPEVPPGDDDLSGRQDRMGFTP